MMKRARISPRLMRSEIGHDLSFSNQALNLGFDFFCYFSVAFGISTNICDIFILFSFSFPKVTDTLRLMISFLSMEPSGGIPGKFLRVLP